MNSQDKPSEANNIDDKSADVWTEDNDDNEIVTEFLSPETTAPKNTEAVGENLIEERGQPQEEKKADLDLDDWDFRNVDYSTDVTSEKTSATIKSNTPEEDLWDADEIDSSGTDSSLLGENSEKAHDWEIDDVASSELLESLEQKFSPAIDELSESADLDDGMEAAFLQEPIVEPSSSSSEQELWELEGLSAAAESGSDEPSLDQVLSSELEPTELPEDSNLEGISLDLELASSPQLEDSELDLAPLGEAEFSLDEAPELESIELSELDDLTEVTSLADDELDSLLDLNATDLNATEEPLDLAPLEGLDELDEIESTLVQTAEGLNLDSLLTVTPAAKSSSEPAPQTPVASATPQFTPAKPQVFDQTMRVSVRKLDNLNNLIGELVVKRNRLEDDQERLRRFLDNLLGHVQTLGEAGAKMHDMYERSLLEGALMASRQSRANATVAAGAAGFIEQEAQEEGLDALEMDRFNGFHLLSQEIIELIVRVRESASDIQFVVDETDKVAQTFRQVTSQLQDGMNSSRMVAFGQAADRLPRAVRDISRKQKKQTQLHVEGKDVLIDKMIVEHLYNPMTHLVNNAISHGIERPEIRLQSDKPEVGNVYIRAFIQGNQTVITVRDDGAGIDPEKVKEKAIEKNLITWATAQNMSEQQVYELLFHPGFSTKDQADDFAGRGVGMDVVNTDLKKIRGSISTESEIGKGTIFTVRLPLVLSICKALTCVDNHMKIAFPIDGVEDTKEYLPSDIQTNVNGVRCISWKDTLLPLRPLNTLLNYNRQIRRTGIYNANQNNDDTISVVILRSLDNLLAVEVDEVRAEQEIVIKQIDGPIPKPPGIAGATVLGDGSIMPIGDVLELIEIAQGKRTIEIGFNILAGEGDVKQAEAESIQQEPLVLVVDDSITVRELLSMSFNKLGYRVEQARDGQEAWDKLRGGLVPDMVFSDIEMPRMNGLELLSNLHQSENLKSIPVAMLTSRGADKHRNLANDLGAKAYLTKPYTEKDLMDVAQHLIEINRANKEAESATVSISKVKSSSEFPDAPLVLIIDDSVTVRELLSMSFKKAGYRVEQARDGQEAWEKLSEGLECDIAFCDIEMPRMNGLELLSQLQKDEKLAQLPIAMLTSRGAQKMRNIAATRGANGYFVKPYVEDELLKAAERMMAGEILIERVEEDN